MATRPVKSIGWPTSSRARTTARRRLPGDIHAGFSGIGVFYPDGAPTQRVGVRIDITVTPTIGAIRERRDGALEAALRHILGASVPNSEIARMASVPSG
jgi:hypothetical protein